MERRKILVIGMFDSIHLARWLFQFENETIDFVLFPSKKFKYVKNSELQICETIFCFQIYRIYGSFLSFNF
jgi:hypothetical protein